jgi:hypothetical protein
MAALRITAPVALAAALLPLGCSLLLSTPGDQCTVDADCADLGSAFAGTVCIENTCQPKPPPPDPTWGCIGHVPVPEGGAMVEVTVQLLDLLTSMPVPGLTVQLCNKYDPPCASPLEIGLTPDAQGNVTVTVASDFEGYLLVEGAGYLNTLVFLDPLAQPKNEAVLIVSTSEEAGLASAAAVTLNPDGGLLIVRTANCEYDPSAGVSVTLAPSDMQTGFYVINNGLSTSATQTDTSGNAGFVNVTPGTPTITGTLGPGGEELGQITTLVRAGSLTFQILRPTPTP